MVQDSLTEASGCEHQEVVTSVYQQLLDYIVCAIFRLQLIKTTPDSQVETIRKEVDLIIQEKEQQFCVALDWNLNQLTGYDFLQLLLQASNQGYNFKRLVAQIEALLSTSMSESKSYFLLFDDSYFYMAGLKLLAIQKGWRTFFTDLIQLVSDHQLDIDLPKLDQAFVMLLTSSI